MISQKTYIWLFLLVAAVYLAGMFLPLMENDSAQFGAMAFQMFDKNDFLNLMKRDIEYLDKPHLHFWLAAFSFKIFGVHEWSYRLPAVVFSIIGAWSTFRLGKLLYNAETGRLAALILVTAQAFILANHDVRTDAVLTGSTILGIWGLIEFIKREKMKHMVLGAIGVGLAFSTKGQIAIFVAGLSIFFYLLYERKWQIFLKWQILVGLIVFAITISPMVYAYYQQFDLHPEKIVNGQQGVSGVRFIFWNQSFERLTGQRGLQTNSEYFFFYHTFLWAFLPWSLISVIAIFVRIKEFIQISFVKKAGYEFLTIGGLLAIFHVINLAQFKLPHYINILFPLFAILTASYLYRLQEQGKLRALKTIRIIQVVIISLLAVLVIVLNMWAFPIDNVFLAILYLGLLGFLIYQLTKKAGDYCKIVVGSALIAVFLNFMLNTNFYQKLLQYQGGYQLVKMAKAQNFDLSHTYCLDDGYSRTLDFYSQGANPSLSLEEIQQKIEHDEKVSLFVYESQKVELEQKGIRWKKSLAADHFRVSMLTPKFLNPATRDQALSKAYLLELN